MAIKRARSAHDMEAGAHHHALGLWSKFQPDSKIRVHGSRLGAIMAGSDNDGNLQGGMVMGEYLLYDWKGKLKWAYLEGVYLVDPHYEAEFLERENERHLRPDLYLAIN